MEHTLCREANTTFALGVFDVERLPADGVDLPNVVQSADSKGKLMLPRKTCLLLGAGASQHLGYPLGNALRMSMLQQLGEHSGRTLKEKDADLFRGDEDLDAFYEKLAYGNWKSPDAFLEHYPEFIKSGKYLICSCLARHENPASIVTNGGWYDKLLDAIHTDDYRKLSDNFLSVVTFNYDRSLDFRLHTYVQHRFNLPEKDAWSIVRDSIPIIHLHGTLGGYPEYTYGDKASLLLRSQSIKIIHEVVDDEPYFKLASQLLNEADRVIVIGFGFGEANVRRLNFFKEKDKEEREIIVISGIGNNAVDHNEYKTWMKRWGLTHGKHWWHHSSDEMFKHVMNPFS